MALNGRLAVIGIGSPIMTDDSIGLRISENIQKMGMGDVDCFQEAVGGLELLPLLRGYSYAVIVDAIQTWNYAPGTILIFDVADFESTVHDVPSHDINVATAIKIGREMDPTTMPLQIKFVAMEIEDMATMSESLTPVVAEKQESAEKAVLFVLDEFRKDRDQISSEENSNA
ncbi:MAG: hydrogenase maturation protease [archaeon]|nr:hydrogenase maturation protease [archaeon]